MSSYFSLIEPTQRYPHTPIKVPIKAPTKTAGVFVLFMRARELVVVIALLLFLTACANFVVLSPAASRVELISVAEAENCEKIADTHVKVVTKVGIIRRDWEKAQVEAQNVAKNAAPDFDANAVAPLNELSEDGKQIFGIYQCDR